MLNMLLKFFQKYYFHFILFKYFPGRYEHLESNFREERGLETVSEKLREVGLPSVGYLDYAWLQKNYYRERPQG